MEQSAQERFERELEAALTEDAAKLQAMMPCPLERIADALARIAAALERPAFRATEHLAGGRSYVAVNKASVRP